MILRNALLKYNYAQASNSFYGDYVLEYNKNKRVYHILILRRHQQLIHHHYHHHHH